MTIKMQGRLSGKIAVITQGAGSFGQTIAKAYAQEGATVVLQEWPERIDRARAIAAEIAAAGGTIQAAEFDITTGVGTEAFTKSLLNEHGRVDVLVNTAMQGGHGVLFDIREREWDLCIDRGLKSYFLTCQHLGEEMAKRGYGKIINVTSVVADLGSGGAVPWGACRGGVNSLTYACAHSLGEYGVRVVGLVRGATNSTPYAPEAKQARLKRLPLGRLGTEEDLTGPAIFLATSESDWITGSIVYCEGGYVRAAATDEEHRATERVLSRSGTKMDPNPRPPERIDAVEK